MVYPLFCRLQTFAGVYVAKHDSGPKTLGLCRMSSAYQDAASHRAEFGADARVCALPIVDCQRHLTETLVCLREQRTRRVVATFLQMVQEGL